LSSTHTASLHPRWKAAVLIGDEEISLEEVLEHIAETVLLPYAEN
jgi:hypothetical protein